MNLVLLTIVAPAGLKDELLELLLKHPDRVPGFTISPAEGHGADLAFLYGSHDRYVALVKRALQGYLRDDVWVYDRRVYRVAARPVMAGRCAHDRERPSTRACCPRLAGG